ncbi:hypothetical protein DSD19_04570 [Rhodovulum sp. BSW8]|uniref:hypothetical protein n=1 Tax=Rhodovulum sp. BSW8 TaxID=2259645 RepID=UPI000DE3536E|nr:hypothetical protein [Rhodovulum sp. BSW8]RBO54655.1 hypothetical protein DSD19_04570 [Rhodovulum sp. BSW8]
MTMFKTPYAKGLLTPPTPYVAGAEMVAIYTFAFTKAYSAATDIIELGPLPGGAKLTGATLIGDGLGALTADVGLMTGESGALADSEGSQRALTTALLFDAASVNDNESNATLGACLGIPAEIAARGIGATLSGNVAAGAAKTLTLLLRYTF